MEANEGPYESALVTSAEAHNTARDSLLYSDAGGAGNGNGFC